MFELVEEMFRATKPGLSAFADEPQKVLYRLDGFLKIDNVRCILG